MERDEPFEPALMEFVAEDLRRWAGAKPHPWYWHFAAKRVLLAEREYAERYPRISWKPGTSVDG